LIDYVSLRPLQANTLLFQDQGNAAQSELPKRVFPWLDAR
jgi:hypothetical protein